MDIYIPGSSTTNVTKKSTNVIIPSDVVFETDRINLTCGGNNANGTAYHAAFCFPTLIDFTGQNFFVIDTYMHDMSTNGSNLFIYLMNTSTLQDNYYTKPTPIHELSLRNTSLFASKSAKNKRCLGVIDVRDISGSYYIHVVAICDYWERINVDILRMFFMP